MKKRRTKNNGRQFAGIGGGDLDTSMFWFGDLNVWGSFPTIPTVYQKPRSSVFYMTRNWFERQVFIKAITLLRQSIYDYQFQIVATKESAQDTVDEWVAANELMINTFRRDAWTEWLTMDNVISVWRPNRGRALVFPVEHVAYNDDFGIEQLAFAHGMVPDQVNRLPGLSDAERKALVNNKDLTITKQGKNYMDGTGNVFRFEVLKRTRVGIGLAWPQLRTIFNTVGGWESLELADWQLADAMRNVYEFHQVGHEIKSGTHAGKAAHFLKKPRAEAIIKQIKNDKKLLARIIQMVVNFDHQISWPRPDPKHFGSERFGGFLEKLILWAMPLSQMLFMKQLNPYLMPFFKAQVEQERGYLRPYLKTIFRETLKMPAEADIQWGSDIFWDSRLMLDILKQGLAAGPLSQTSWLKKTGFNPEQERRLKDEENDLAPHQVMPVYDPAHGNDPTAENGRPAGSKDKRGRKNKNE